MSKCTKIKSAVSVWTLSLFFGLTSQEVLPQDIPIDDLYLVCEELNEDSTFEYLRFIQWVLETNKAHQVRMPVVKEISNKAVNWDVFIAGNSAIFRRNYAASFEVDSINLSYLNGMGTGYEINRLSGAISIIEPHPALTERVSGVCQSVTRTAFLERWDRNTSEIVQLQESARESRAF
ncbi:MAG: hypothetical protein CL926_04605 [Deltaproteobacteria bacterium]|jgi:hypothetical protein|nr:hypothetical protein [Gammaproteobacteria bacterium]MBP78540.1 hypothetical protein [Deltaproteobacteria bacterium]|tara:strand:+ start:989 stop:1522 length:534 start_codon:yes stop_codon:yes gene_type:complete